MRCSHLGAGLVCAALVATSADARPELLAEAAGGAVSSPEPCGTVLTPEEAKEMLRKLESRPTELRGPAPPYFIPIAPHIVRRSDGTGGLPESRYQQAMADANVHFANTGMFFYTGTTIDYIDSDFYYFEVDTNSEINDLRTQNLVPGMINIYFTENMPYCGISAFSTSSVQSILMLNACTANDTGLGNHSTYSHEIGHFFDLYHTHETFFGDELVDGSNCDVAGDLVCDTPADPLLDTSNVTVECVYVGSETDSNGDRYEPDASQLMSYSRKHCRDNFSPESELRAVATLLAERDSLFTNPTDVPLDDAGTGRVSLSAPRPNPSRGTSEMRLSVARRGLVEVTVYDVAGARVRTIASGLFEPGEYAIGWDGVDSRGSRAAPGIYFARMTGGGESFTVKVQRVR